jgi:hypothetical protein
MLKDSGEDGGEVLSCVLFPTTETWTFTYVASKNQLRQSGTELLTINGANIL